MNSNIRENDFYNNMEFLVEELHREWDRTGAVKASVYFTCEEAEKLLDRIAHRIAVTQEAVKEDYLTFQESMILTKECHVMLRLSKKVLKKWERAEGRNKDGEFTVSFDREELDLFKELLMESP